MEKITVIHIMTHPPAYEEHSDKPRPECNWDTPDGSWVGIWGYDWADQLAIEVSRITDKFTHEIWQPDCRADKIYSNEIFSGVVHKSFPAKQIKMWNGIKRSSYTNSDEMINCLTSLPDNSILHLSHPIYDGLNKKIINNFRGNVISSYHGIINLPINYLLMIQWDPFKKISYLIQHFRAKRYFKLVNHVTFMNNTNVILLRKYYSGALTKLTMGIDTNKFKVLDKKLCKKKLGLPENKKILLTVSRLYNHKQIDRIIEILDRIDGEFVFVVLGHGTINYENYLKEKATSLINNKKIRFEGYKTGDELIEYLNSADAFILASKSEGASVAVMEAMACGLPIICTDTGNTAEVLKENNAGIVMGIKNYKEWEKELNDYFKGKPIKVLDIEFVKEHYEWKNIARKFAAIYDKVKV
ncbi:MAG: glycosyltransferase [Bacteroidales bacterium]